VNQSTDKASFDKPKADLLPTWLIITLFGLIGLGLILGGYFFFTSQEKIIRQNSYGQLAAISHLKIEEILRWRNEREADLNVSIQGPFFRTAISDLVLAPDNSAQRKEALDRLELIKTFYAYHNVMLVLPSGGILLSTEPDTNSLEPETLALIQQAAAENKVIFGDFFRSQISGSVYLDLAGPILDNQNRVAALLILRIDPNDYLFPSIQEWPVPSASAETLLVRRDGDEVLFLNQLRHERMAPLTFRQPLTNSSLPASRAVLGDSGPMEGVDYRGVAVVADLQPVPNTSWFMVTKVDRDEIFADLSNLRTITIIVVVLAMVLIFILAAYVFNIRQRISLQRVLQAEKELSNSRLETRTILYGIGDGVIAVNQSGQITHMNPVAEQLTGWSEKDILGRPLEDIFNLIDEATGQPLPNPVRTVLKDGQVSDLPTHSLLVSRGGGELPIADSAAPVFNELGGISGAVMVFRDQTRERQVQKELSLFADTLSASLNEIYIFECEGLFYRTANTGALKNLGLTLKKIQEQTPLAIKPDFTRHSFQQLVRPLIQGKKKSLVYETIHRRVDGSTYPAECHLQLIDRYGERLFLEVALDITIRRQDQEALRESEQRHRLLADNVHDVIWTTDPEGHLTYISPSVEVLLGYAPEDFLGKKFEEYLPAKSAAAINDALQDNMMGLQLGLPFKSVRVEIQQSHKYGDPIWVDITISGIYNDDAILIGMVGVTRDITERRRIEEALRLSEERYRLLAENVYDIIWMSDKNGRISYISPSVKKTMGFDAEYFLGKRIFETMPPEKTAALKPLLFGLLKAGNAGQPVESLSFELERTRKDGSMAWLEVTVGGVSNAEGKFLGLAGVTRDVSVRRQVEEKLAFRRHFAELLSRISTLFISLATNQVDQEVTKALGDISTFMEIDRAFVFTFDEAKTSFTLSHEWNRPDRLEPEIDLLPLLTHSSSLKTLQNNQVVILDGKANTGASGDVERAFLPPEMGSIAIFPLWINQQLYGSVCFQLGDPARILNPDSVSLLLQFSNVLSSTFERTRLVREIERQAVRDELTGAFNRRGLMEIGLMELHRARRYNHALGLIFFDIDYFKQINDTYGHVAGDLVLKEVVRRSEEVIREVDIFCRWGGDEFLVLLPESDVEFSCQVGNRLHERISCRPFSIRGDEIQVSISVGVSGASSPTVTLEEMLRNVDDSLYAAKFAGRNTVYCGKFI
jgi:diguanylate cyclase (GGDEF)-like protein/PAS domain S-box-containing protein